MKNPFRVGDTFIPTCALEAQLSMGGEEYEITEVTESRVYWVDDRGDLRSRDIRDFAKTFRMTGPAYISLRDGSIVTYTMAPEDGTGAFRDMTVGNLYRVKSATSEEISWFDDVGDSCATPPKKFKAHCVLGMFTTGRAGVPLTAPEKEPVADTPNPKTAAPSDVEIIQAMMTLRSIPITPHQAHSLLEMMVIYSKSVQGI